MAHNAVGRSSPERPGLRVCIVLAFPALRPEVPPHAGRGESLKSLARVGRKVWAMLGERWDEEDYVDLVKFLAVTLIFVAVIVGLLLLVGQCTAGDYPT